MFGRVLDQESLLVVHKIENLPCVEGTNQPKLHVIISECGEL